MFGDVVEDFLTDRATLTRRGLNDKSRNAYRQDIAAWARQLHVDAGGEPDADVLALVPISALTDQNVRIAYRSLRTFWSVSAEIGTSASTSASGSPPASTCNCRAQAAMSCR